MTGRDNMKTYTFQTKNSYIVDPLLRDLGIKFVREKIGNQTTYLIDLEPMSPHIQTLKENDECRIVLEEINHIPEQFKNKLLTDKEPYE